MSDSTAAGVTAAGAAWTLRPATAEDLEWVADLRAVVLRPDLERLGRYDAGRVRERLRRTFDPAHSSIIEVDGEPRGSVTLRADDGDGRGLLLEHFYLASELQGRGVGTAVLRALLAAADAAGTTVRLVVVQGSAARRLYERLGFTIEGEDPIDIFMVRPPAPVAV